jgi:hypothetical protein
VRGSRLSVNFIIKQEVYRMAKKTKEPERPPEAQAPEPGMKRPSGPMFSAEPPKAEGPRPLMSSELPRPADPAVIRGPMFEGAVQSSAEFADMSDLGIIGRIGTREELAEFRKTLEARRKAERDQPRPAADTLWHCERCGYDCRMAQDQKRPPFCFRCNPMMVAGRPRMVPVVGEVAAFLERERVEKKRWQESLAKAKELAAKRNAELALLQKHGMG